MTLGPEWASSGQLFQGKAIQAKERCCCSASYSMPAVSSLSYNNNKHT